jgi:hypothetical protein
VAGIYTFGSLNGLKQLTYATIYNYWNDKVAPNPVRLKLPSGTASIASAANESGNTCLFVSHTDGLSVYLPDAQIDEASPVNCITRPLVSGATELSASTVGSLTSVWGRNVQGGLFYTTCSAGSEVNTFAWKTPVP